MLTSTRTQSSRRWNRIFILMLVMLLAGSSMAMASRKDRRLPKNGCKTGDHLAYNENNKRWECEPAAQLNCVTRSQSFTGFQTTVSCKPGETRTGGGWQLSDGNNNGFNWNTAGARPVGDKGYLCERNVFNPGSFSICYAICCTQ